MRLTGAFHRHARLLAWVSLLLLVTAASCAGAEQSEEPAGAAATDTVAAPTAPEDTPGTEADEDTPSTTSTAVPGGDASGLRVAALFPGAITDADYNALGFLALETAQEELGIEMGHSENVPVPDVERVMREYVSEGYNVVWTHGSQFYEPTLALAGEFPDVNFIGEFDAEPEDAPGNLWVIDRNFHTGFYPLGVLAGMLTESGRIGYIGGLSLPFSYAEVHALQQALADQGLDAELVPVWSGDFNDPTAARQLAGQLISQDVDVLVGSLNLGMVGVFEAGKAEPAGEMWVTAKYTDKSQFAPEHYVTSVLYDFEGPLADILGSIAGGETGGYYPLGFETGVNLQFPLQNVPDEVNAEVESIVEQVRSGDIEVEKNVEPVE